MPPQEHPVRKSTYDPLYCGRICDCLYKHLAAPVNISRMAAYAGLSFPYCCSVFKRHTGIPIIQYLSVLLPKNIFRASGTT